MLRISSLPQSIVYSNDEKGRGTVKYQLRNNMLKKYAKKEGFRMQEHLFSTTSVPVISWTLTFTSLTQPARACRSFTAIVPFAILPTDYMDQFSLPSTLENSVQPDVRASHRRNHLNLCRFIICFEDSGPGM